MDLRICVLLVAFVVIGDGYQWGYGNTQWGEWGKPTIQDYRWKYPGKLFIASCI